jgi:hypothetical protein
MAEINIKPVHNVHKKYRQVNFVNPYIFTPPVPPNPLLTGLVAYYPLDSNSNDLKNGYNGTNTNISYVASGVGNGASFNGSSSFISVADQNSFSFTDGTNDTPFSIGFGIKLNAVSGYRAIISKFSAGNYEWEIRMNGSNMEVVIYNQAGTSYLYKITGTTLSANTYYKVLITYSSQTILIYFNNVDIGGTTQNTGGYTKMTNTTSPVLFGKSATNGFFLNGIMDDVCIWNRVLPSTERTDNYNRTTNLI